VILEGDSEHPINKTVASERDTIQQQFFISFVI